MVKTELKLEHLAPYLPYGLICDWTDCRNPEMEKVTGKLYTLGINGTVSIDANGGYHDCMVCECIPHLRPLSDLTKSITYNNELFIPILYLNRMRGVMLDFDKYDEIFSDNKLYGCTWGGLYSFYFEHQTMSFYDNIKTGISPQLEMFQKLFEWHFDVFNLMENNLAIDINSLK